MAVVEARQSRVRIVECQPLGWPPHARILHSERLLLAREHVGDRCAWAFFFLFFLFDRFVRYRCSEDLANPRRIARGLGSSGGSERVGDPRDTVPPLLAAQADASRDDTPDVGRNSWRGRQVRREDAADRLLGA